MKAKTTPDEMSLQEKAICLVFTGRRPELPYPLKEVECADGIPSEDKAEAAGRPLPLR